MTALSKIVVNSANLETLHVALVAEQGRAKVFPTTETLIGCAADLEYRLERSGVAPSNRVGCTYEYCEAGPEAAAYRYMKKVVTFSLKRTAKGWVITSVGNTEVYPKQGEIDRINLTPKAKEAVLRRAMAGYGTITAKAA